MANFQYTARDSKGEQTNGAVSAATEAEAIAAKHPWLTPMDALNRLDNNGNPNVQAAPPPKPDAGDGEEESEDGEDQETETQ
jgi:hypothetical protein